MSDAERLAVDGGTPVRDLQKRPWPSWPEGTERDWSQRIEPALRAVYQSRVEGLPGPQAQAFARKFAECCGTKYARLLVHGTDAIAAALAAVLNLDAWGEGSEVILPNYTFIASASAAIERRCTLAFVDIDPQTFTISPAAVEAAVIPGKTRAIMPVHLTGQPADMAAINAIASRHDLKVVEDCAQAHGATCDRRPVGSLGQVGAFSFQSTKNVTAGEGGAITTDDEELYNRVAGFMDVGRHPTGGRWDYPRLGWNHRPSEYIAALLSVRLEDLEGQAQRRERNAKALTARLAEVPGVTPPKVAPWCTRHAYYLYGILMDPGCFGGRSREDVLAAVNAEGVRCWAAYATPLAEQPALRHLREKYPQSMRVLPCPNVEHVCRHLLWLPQYTLLGDADDVRDIAEAFAKVQRAFSRK